MHPTLACLMLATLLLSGCSTPEVPAVTDETVDTTDPTIGLTLYTDDRIVTVDETNGAEPFEVDSNAVLNFVAGGSDEDGGVWKVAIHPVLKGACYDPARPIDSMGGGSWSEDERGQVAGVSAQTFRSTTFTQSVQWLGVLCSPGHLDWLTVEVTATATNFAGQTVKTQPIVWSFHELF